MKVTSLQRVALGFHGECRNKIISEEKGRQCISMRAGIEILSMASEGGLVQEKKIFAFMDDCEQLTGQNNKENFDKLNAIIKKHTGKDVEND